MVEEGGEHDAGAYQGIHFGDCDEASRLAAKGWGGDATGVEGECALSVVSRCFGDAVRDSIAGRKVMEVGCGESEYGVGEERVGHHH